MELTDIHEEMVREDGEMMKVAAEEDAAGRIMARGFMDELTKLSGVGFGSAPSGKPLTDTSSIPAGAYKTEPTAKKGRRGLGIDVWGKRRVSNTIGKTRPAVGSAPSKSGPAMATVKEVRPPKRAIPYRKTRGY